jgi:hypothetical protein
MGNDFVKITDYEATALESQVEFFKDKANLNKLLEIAARVIQDREDGLAGIHDLNFLDLAFGIHLDRHGEYLNVLRGLDNDDVYRNRIKTAIHELNNGGQIEPLIAAFKTLVAANRIIIDEYFPETVILTALVDDTTIANPETINAAMQRVRAAGIEMDIGVAKDGASFKFASVTNQTGTGRGFSSTALGGDGGKFAKIIE